MDNYYVPTIIEMKLNHKKKKTSLKPLLLRTRVLCIIFLTSLVIFSPIYLFHIKSLFYNFHLNPRLQTPLSTTNAVGIYVI